MRVTTVTRTARRHRPGRGTLSPELVTLCGVAFAVYLSIHFTPIIVALVILALVIRHAR
jgi:hypothetical protein